MQTLCPSLQLPGAAFAISKQFSTVYRFHTRDRFDQSGSRPDQLGEARPDACSVGRPGVTSHTSGNETIRCKNLPELPLQCREERREPHLIE